jgi:hypothetical protein
MRPPAAATTLRTHPDSGHASLAHARPFGAHVGIASRRASVEMSGAIVGCV